MFNQLLTFPDRMEHYFSAGNSIFRRKPDTNGGFDQTETVISNGVSAFCAYGDSAGIAHIIHTDPDNNLYYSQMQGGQIKTHRLSSIPAEIYPENFRLYSVGGRLNLLYSARYQEGYILVHCILGNQAKPHIVAQLDSAHFQIFKGNVYYTNSQGDVGYTALADEKPEGFSLLFEKGKNVSVLEADEAELVIYTRDNKLFAGGNQLVYDSRMEMPTLYLSHNKPTVTWKSGGYVRSITLNKDGTPASSPMRFMASDAEIQTFHTQIADNTRMLYGYNTSYGLHLFGKPDLA